MTRFCLKILMKEEKYIVKENKGTPSCTTVKLRHYMLICLTEQKIAKYLSYHFTFRIVVNQSIFGKTTNNSRQS